MAFSMIYFLVILSEKGIFLIIIFRVTVSLADPTFVMLYLRLRPYNRNQNSS